jgi:hypothetical protein
MALAVEANVLDKKREFAAVPVLRNLVPLQVLMGKSSFNSGGSISAGLPTYARNEIRTVADMLEADTTQRPSNAKVEPAAVESKPVGAIHVLSATYGANCGASPGNVTNDVQTSCEGGRKCTYTVDVERLGDPAPECAKDFIVTYSCASDAPILRKDLPAEAGFRSVVDLSCGPASRESTKP